jgi:hypothetical protein
MSFYHSTQLSVMAERKSCPLMMPRKMGANISHKPKIYMEGEAESDLSPFLL